VELFDAATVDEIVSTVTHKIAEYTIDIPKIVVLPTRDVNYGFNDFDLSGLERISLKPQYNEIIISNLETSQISSINWEKSAVSEARLENYLVF
ncbi:hypothetical protein, partial [Staphylococcus aureus]|uniref:hypothetical protein n=1 Tax=Staphylococcus aureus TaxID=1280 RepID=UPI00301C7B6B